MSRVLLTYRRWTEVIILKWVNAVLYLHVSVFISSWRLFNQFNVDIFLLNIEHTKISDTCIYVYLICMFFFNRLCHAACQIIIIMSTCNKLKSSWKIKRIDKIIVNWIFLQNINIDLCDSWNTRCNYFMVNAR